MEVQFEASLLFEKLRRICELEKKEIHSSDNCWYAAERVHNNPDELAVLYQYFLHGGPNHLLRMEEFALVRDFLKKFVRKILLPDFDSYLFLQEAIAFSPRGRKAYSERHPDDRNPSDQKIMLDFVERGGARWYAEHFTYPEKIRDTVLVVLQPEI